MTKASIIYAGDMRFVGISGSNHSLVMDSNQAFGGNDSGLRPMELLLLGLGGCAGMDIVSILKKKRQRISSLEIQIEAHRAPEHPRKFTEIKIEFVVKGKNISEEAMKRSVSLSMDKYCSVKATLEGSTKVTYSYRINEEEN